MWCRGCRGGCLGPGAGSARRRRASANPSGARDGDAGRAGLFDLQPDRDQGRVFAGAEGQERFDRGEALVGVAGLACFVSVSQGESGDGSPVDGSKVTCSRRVRVCRRGSPAAGSARSCRSGSVCGLRRAGAGQMDGQPGADQAEEVIGCHGGPPGASARSRCWRARAGRGGSRRRGGSNTRCPRCWHAPGAGSGRRSALPGHGRRGRTG